jgi:hypothetical protein
MVTASQSVLKAFNVNKLTVGRDIQVAGLKRE